MACFRISCFAGKNLAVVLSQSLVQADCFHQLNDCASVLASLFERIDITRDDLAVQFPDDYGSWIGCCRPTDELSRCAFDQRGHAHARVRCISTDLNRRWTD